MCVVCGVCTCMWVECVVFVVCVVCVQCVSVHVCDDMCSGCSVWNVRVMCKCAFVRCV